MLKQVENMNFLDEDYEKKVHLTGRITLFVGFMLVFLPPFTLWLFYGIVPPAKSLINGIISISVIMIPMSIVEILSFCPIIGSSGMYMSYLTGNITNLKIPSAAIAMDVAEVKPSTKEGDIISTIGIAGSVIASEIVIVLSVIFILPISSQFQNPVIQPAFQQILPALFGSLGAYYILRDWKLAVVPMFVAIAINMAVKLPTAVTIPVCVLSSVMAAKFMYKKGLIKVKE